MCNALHEREPALAERFPSIVKALNQQRTGSSSPDRLTNGTIKDNVGINATDVVVFVQWLEESGLMLTKEDIKTKLNKLKLFRFCSYIMENDQLDGDKVAKARRMFLTPFFATCHRFFPRRRGNYHKLTQVIPLGQDGWL